MYSIDTIKFKISYSVSDEYSIKAEKKEYKNHIIKTIKRNYNSHIIKIRNKKNYILIKGSNKPSDKHYIFIKLDKINHEGLFYYKAFVTIHLNNLIFNAFDDLYYIPKNEVIKEIYTLLEKSLLIGDFENRDVVFAEFHVSKDIFLNYDVTNYMQVLKFCNMDYYYPYQKNINRTITIHKFEDLMRLEDDNFKSKNFACIYDKSNKLSQFYKEKPASNILRFEYKFIEKHKTEIGIKRNCFFLSDIYSIDLKSIMDKYFFNKYLKKEYLKFNYNDLQKRQDKSQESTYRENLHPIVTYPIEKAWVRSKSVKRQLGYKCRRFYEVNFKKYLKKKFTVDNVNGLDLYKEICEKVLERTESIEGDKIPNIYKIYLN